MRRALSMLVLLVGCSPDPEPQPAPLPDPVEAAPVAEAPPPAPAYSREDLTCLARAAYHEARGEGGEGMAAVVHVVLNRTEALAWPDEPCAVVEQGANGRCQFSWFCDGKSDEPRNLVLYDRALDIARGALEGEIADPTDGAVMFHAARITPYWTEAAEKTAEIGAHVFYRLDE